MSKKVRGSAFDFSSTMTGGGVTWQRSRTFTVSNEAMWARWYKNATEVLQIYTNFDHLRLHKIQDEVHTPAFFPKKNWRVPNLWAFYKFGGRFGMNNIGGSGRVCLKWWGFSMFLVPRVPHDANLGCQQIAVQLFIFTLIQLVYTLYSFIFNYLKKIIFYINNF